MARLSEEMRQLRGEVEAGYQMRDALIKDLGHFKKNLASGVASMQKELQETRAATGNQLKTERQTFIKDLANQVGTMRSTFKKELTEGVAAMRSDLQKAHTNMANELRANHNAFIKDLTGGVATMRAGFESTRKAMVEETQAAAKESQDTLDAFVSGLRQTVSNMTNDLLTDRQEARRIWLGVAGATSSPPPQKSSPPPKPQAKPQTQAKPQSVKAESPAQPKKADKTGASKVM